MNKSAQGSGVHTSAGTGSKLHSGGRKSRSAGRRDATEKETFTIKGAGTQNKPTQSKMHTTGSRLY